jgi:outer membrane protein assembly factor BamB
MAESTCIDPKDGTVLWRAACAVHSDESGCVAVTEDYLVCSGGGRRGGSGMQCYRITPQGATKAWSLGPEYAVKQYCSPTIYQGHVYARAGDQNNTAKMFCVDLINGKVVGSADCGGSCNETVAVDGRLFYENSYQGPQMYAADPKNFRLLSDGVLGALDFACSVPPAIAGGRLFYRSNSHGIVCLDLRKGATEGRPLSELAVPPPAPPHPGPRPTKDAPAKQPTIVKPDVTDSDMDRVTLELK